MATDGADAPAARRGGSATRARDVLDVVLRVVAAALVVSLFVAACHDASQAYDGWFYHLPFAARLGGVVGASEYALSRANQARFDGFPLAAELLQGVVWRITGRVECANLVAFAAVPALAVGLRRAFAVPPHLTILALVAVPLVQIHATATYVDLPANAAAALLALLAFRAVSEPRPPSVPALAIAGALAAFAANAKFQLLPLVLAAGALLVLRSIRPDGGRARRLATIAIAAPIVLFTPLRNALLYGNPVWPVELSVFGRALPHAEEAYASSPAWLEHAPRQVRFLCSVLEIGLRPIASHARWSLDQWTPPDHPAYRMGGFFGAFVVVNVAALALAVKQRLPHAKRAAWFFGGVTAIVASMPQSHELRYYMAWMIVLVALNLVLWGKRAPRACGLVATGALAVVAWSTDGAYLYASGDSARTLVAKKVDARSLEGVRAGERICVARAPWTFLYAPAFHADAPRYTVQEADGPADCAGARSLDAPPAVHAAAPGPLPSL